MGGAYGTHEKEYKCTEGFGGEIDRLEDQNVDRKITLKCILKEIG
jgi:hypothetical protein